MRDGGEYVLKEGEEIVGKIPEIESEPVGVWVNKREVFRGGVHGRYELVVQFANGSINFYEIRAESSNNSVVSIKWKK